VATQETETCRVLLVDDDPGIRKTYARLLGGLGFTVDTAADGQEAAHRMATGSFDVIVSDLQMPKIGGLQFLRTVRQRDLDVPVVLMTGEPDLQTAVAAVEQGAFRYLTKPVDLEQLAEVLRRAASMHRLAKLKREALEVAGIEGMQLGDRASLEARFNNALDRLWMAYQPIVHWPDRTAFSYEALVRSDEPSLASPMELLDAAERLGRLHDLGRRLRGLVARAAPEAPKGALLFVNLHPLDLGDAELLAPASALAAIAPRVVLEITERASLDGLSDLAATIAKLRRLGFRIAIDDLGAGYAGLSSFSRLEPEFVKLDISLVCGVDSDPRKRSLARAMIQLCVKELGIQVIGEGVETAAERDVLATDGCKLMQGFLFAKPSRGFAAPRW
jgi:EAL domain-containing protein (putative c-di-GMP-specific phosphodiesterase class I)